MRSKFLWITVAGMIFIALFAGCSKAQSELLDVIDMELKLVVVGEKDNGNLIVYNYDLDPELRDPFEIDEIERFQYVGKRAFIVVKKLSNKRTNEVQYVYTRDFNPE